MRSGLVDFHCHLDLYPDHAAAVERCQRDGVFTLTVTTTPKAWPRNNERSSDTRYVRAALGAEQPHEKAQLAHMHGVRPTEMSATIIRNLKALLSEYT